MKKISVIIFLAILSISTLGFLLFSILQYNKVKEIDANFLSKDWWKTASISYIKKNIKLVTDINEKNKNGETPLSLAIKYNGQEEVVNLLIKEGAEVYPIFHNKDAQGNTLFMHIITNCSSKTIETMLEKLEEYEKKSLINSTNNAGETVLMIAARFNPNPDVIDTLIKNGADVNISNRNKFKNKSIFAKDEEKDTETALEDAIVYNSLSVIKILIENKADLNTRDTYGRTPLMKAAMYNENISVLQELIKNGAKTEAKDSFGATLLMKAASKNKNIKILEEILKYEKNIEAVDRLDDSALMNAALWNTNPEVITFLIKKGAKINRKNRLGENALMLAAKYNKNPEILKRLMQKGLNINEKNNLGENALMLAAKYNEHPEIINFLLDNGADYKLKAGLLKTDTALSYAKHNYKIKDTSAYWRLNDLIE